MGPLTRISPSGAGTLEPRPPPAPFSLIPGRPPTLEELRAFARERLAPAKAPRELIIVPALPRGPSGKLLRRLLPDGEAHVDGGPGRDLP